MKKAKNTSTLLFFSFFLVAMGVLLCVSGVLIYQYSAHVHETFLTGKNSMPRIMKAAGITSEDQLETGRERVLFQVIRNSNKKCLDVTTIPVEMSKLLLVLGLGLLIEGACFFSFFAKLRKRVGDGLLNGAHESAFQPEPK